MREVGRGGRAGDRGTMEVDALGGRDACAALVDAARRADLDDDSEESEDETRDGSPQMSRAIAKLPNKNRVADYGW